jgi:hypothetical protein
MNSHHLSLVEWKLDGETRALARADGPEPAQEGDVETFAKVDAR